MEFKNKIKKSFINQGVFNFALGNKIIILKIKPSEKPCMKRLVDVAEKDLRRLLYEMLRSKGINSTGEKKGRKYFIC